MTSDILPDAEPFSAEGGPQGALVLHGFTGCPQSMRSIARRFADEGYAVELPLLPGHGRSVEDMVPTRWADWLATDAVAYADLASRCERVVVVGLSMGATLALQLAIDNPDIAGVVAVNAALMETTDPMRMPVQELIDAGEVTMAGLGNDVADPSQKELAYEEVPLEALMSMLDGIDAAVERLAEVRCPILLLHSPQDHVVPPGAPELVQREVAGPVEVVTLERSYHAATLDYDRALIEDRALAFAREVLAG